MNIFLRQTIKLKIKSKKIRIYSNSDTINTINTMNTLDALNTFSTFNTLPYIYF